MTPRPHPAGRVDLVFKALSDETRRALLEILAHAPEGLAATRLAADFPGISRPAVSKHLRLLVEAGFLTINPRGRERIYRISRAGFKTAYDEWFGKFEEFWRGKLQDLRRYVEDED